MMTPIAASLRRFLAILICQALTVHSLGAPAFAGGGRAVQGQSSGARASAPQISIKAITPASLGLGSARLGSTVDASRLSTVLPSALSNPSMGPSVQGSAAPAADAAAAGLPQASLAPSGGAPKGSAPKAKSPAPVFPAAVRAAALSASAQAKAVTTEVPVRKLDVPGKAGDAGRIAKSLEWLRNVWSPHASPHNDFAPATGALASAFTSKSSGGASEGLSQAGPTRGPPQTSAESAGPPAPPTPPAPGGQNDGNQWFGLGKTALLFIGALLVAQIGVEALGASMPALVQKTFGDFTFVAQLAIFSSIAGIVGRTIASVFIKKHGLKKVYLGSTLIRLISISALCALLATGHMTLPLMMAFYSLNGLLGGVAMTAENSIPPAILGSDQGRIEKFWAWEQTLLEIIGFAGPVVTGMVVASMGFLPALIAFPVSFAVSLLILALTLKIPQKLDAMGQADKKAAPEADKNVGIGGAFKELVRRIGHGAQIVWKTPALKSAFLAYTAYMALNPFLYSMLAPGYALRLVGSPEAAAAVAGWLTGAYSLGGLFGGVITILEQRKIAKQKPTPEQEAETLRRSMLRWMLWGTAGLGLLLTLAFPSPLFLGSLTIPALALIPFGIAQVVSVIKIKSYFQFKTPAADMADAMGFFGAASLVVSTVGLLALRYLFSGLAGFTPFWIISAAMVPLAIYYLVLRRGLDKTSKPQ